MTLVNIESIHKAVEKIDNLNDDALDKLSETYGLLQEDFLGYVASAGMEFENDQLMGLIIYYYNIYFEAFSLQDIKLKKIDEEMIDTFHEEYDKVLEEYMESEDMDLIVSLTNQPNLLSFMAMELEMEDDDGTSLDDETATQLFIVSTAMIAIMNKAIINN
jgi:hypothetical protein